MNAMMMIEKSLWILFIYDHHLHTLFDSSRFFKSFERNKQILAAEHIDSICLSLNLIGLLLYRFNPLLISLSSPLCSLDFLYAKFVKI